MTQLCLQRIATGCAGFYVLLMVTGLYIAVSDQRRFSRKGVIWLLVVRILGVFTCIPWYLAISAAGAGWFWTTLPFIAGLFTLLSMLIF